MDFKFALGERVEDSVTKFRGTITGRAEYNYPHRLLHYVEGRDGTGSPKGIWIEEERLSKVD